VPWEPALTRRAMTVASHGLAGYGNTTAPHRGRFILQGRAKLPKGDYALHAGPIPAELGVKRWVGARLIRFDVTHAIADGGRLVAPDGVERDSIRASPKGNADRAI